jgi:hypothetical protein
LGRGGLQMSHEIVNYTQGTHVLCKGCKKREIFLDRPTDVYVRGGKRYLWLKCQSPVCKSTVKYEEQELSIPAAIS